MTPSCISSTAKYICSYVRHINEEGVGLLKESSSKEKVDLMKLNNASSPVPSGEMMGSKKLIYRRKEESSSIKSSLFQLIGAVGCRHNTAEQLSQAAMACEGRE